MLAVNASTPEPVEIDPLKSFTVTAATSVNPNAPSSKFEIVTEEGPVISR